MWLWIGKIACALAAGISLGLVYFGGLWWTVKRMATSRRPHVLFLLSFFVRLVIAVPVLILVLQFHWSLAVVAVAGMIITRSVLTAKIGRIPEITRPQNGTGDGT